MKQFVPCRQCKGSGPKAGYIYVEVPVGISTQKAVVECECHKKYIEESKLISKAVRSNIWPEAMEYDPSNDYRGKLSADSLKRLIKYGSNIREYLNALVYVYGPNGTQKTTLAQWVGAQAIKQGFTVHYTVMQTLLEISASFTRSDEKQEEKDALLELYKTVDLLIVDESFCKEKVVLYSSGFQLPFLDRLLRERYDIARKGILFVSNTSPYHIAEHKFSKSQQDFIIRNTRNGTALEFFDNYMQSSTDFEIKGLFD